MRIGIVTPNLNQGRYLAQTMDSVLAADPGGLDYVVMDGGSTDDSAAIIAARSGRLAHHESGPDGGLYAALNRGFARMDAEVMGWVNAGDVLLPDSLAIVTEVFRTFPEVEWVTSRVYSFLDERGRLTEQTLHHGFARASHQAGEHLPGFCRAPSLGPVQQESTFWRRRLWHKAGGGLDTRLRLAADFELWVRFFDQAELVSLSAPLGAFRRHAGQLSQAQAGAYLDEARGVLAARGAQPRNRLGQSVSVASRHLLPRALRPLAHRLRIFEPALLCRYDHAAGAWRLERH